MSIKEKVANKYRTQQTASIDDASHKSIQRDVYTETNDRTLQTASIQAKNHTTIVDTFANINLQSESDIGRSILSVLLQRDSTLEDHHHITVTTQDQH